MPMVREEYAEPESFARLLSSIDAAWIEEALEATGVATIRKRRLPAEQVVWLVLGMALYRDWSISRVVSHLHLALPGESGRGVVPSAPVQARARLGDEAMRWLFERCAQTWAHQSADRHRYRGLALYGVDGTTVRTLDSGENRAHFGGQSGGDRGASGYPQARIVTLMALRSHLLAAARFESTTRWRTVKRLGKGDELVELEFSDRSRGRVSEIPERWLVRAVRYERKGFKPQTLLTSLTDPKRFLARELVALYHERWELELGFDEVKTELLEREEALRSKTPSGVAQELWSLGLLYNLVRLEMEQMAAEAGVPPTRISFIAALQFIKSCWIICAAMAPARIPRKLRKLRADLSQFILPPRRSQRLYPRAVKIKMSPYPKKRSKPSSLAWKKAYLTTAK